MQEKQAFSFSDAVREARRDFPEETRNVIFVDLATPGARGVFAAWLDNMDPALRKDALKGTTADELFDYYRFNYEFFAMPGEKGGGLLCFSSDCARRGTNMSQQFIFDHELGHLIVAGGARKPSEIKRLTIRNGNRLSIKDYADFMAATARLECAADGFAVLRGIARKALGPDDVNAIAIERSEHGWRRLFFTHMTTTAIDALLAGQDMAALQALTPQQAKDLAGRNAAEHAPSAADVAGCIKMFKVMGRREDDEYDDGLAAQLRGLVEIVNTAPVDSLSFHIAGRVLGEAFRTGFVDYYGPLDTIDAPKGGWKAVGETLKTRAEGPYAAIMTAFDENALDALPPLQKPEGALATLLRPFRNSM